MPSLPEVIDFAKSESLGLVVEIKERFRVERLIERLADLLEATGARDEALLISYDHVDLRRAKERIPRLRTEGITHCRHADPVAVARAARLDSLSIELERYHPDDARALHGAGIAIRCHLPTPAEIALAQDYGIDPLPTLREWLAAGLIDALSGDDVGFLADLVGSAPLGPRKRLPQPERPASASHAPGDQAVVLAAQVAVAGQRPQREVGAVAVVAQVEHAREADRVVELLVPLRRRRAALPAGNRCRGAPPRCRPRRPPSAPSSAQAVCDGVLALTSARRSGQ